MANRRLKWIQQIWGNNITRAQIRDEEELNAKIERMVMDGPDKLQVITDFDRTLTMDRYENEPVKSSFSVFETCDSLPNDYKEKAQALLNKYRPIEDDTQMTVAEKLPYIEEWWRQSELLLKGLKFQYEDIDRAIRRAIVRLRIRTHEAFKMMNAQKIPVLVLSAGVGDVVELTLKQENLLTENVSVVSNFLKLTEDDDGISKIQGFKGEKLIHVFNKNEHAYLDTHKNDTHLSGRSNVILLGDSLGDANMDGGIPFNTVLRIGYLNSLSMAEDEEYLNQYKCAFDIVLVEDNTMEFLEFLLKRIIDNKNISN